MEERFIKTFENIVDLNSAHSFLMLNLYFSTISKFSERKHVITEQHLHLNV